MPSWEEVRIDPFLNEPLIKPQQIIHTKHRRVGVIIRICDASADLSPAICGLAALAVVQIKSFLRGNFTMFPSIILHIKDMEQVIIEMIQALMILLPVIKMTLIYYQSIFLLCKEKKSKISTKSVTVLRCNAKRG